MIVGLVFSSLALYIKGLAVALTVQDYISDECWYVPAAINLYRKVFGIDLASVSGTTTYTIVVLPSCHEKVEAFLVEDLNATILKDDYEKINAIAFQSSLSAHEVLEGLEHAGLAYCVKNIVPGVLPDQENIDEYMNWEHPLLVKLILGIAMALGGVNPYSWRLPSFLMGILSLLLLALCGVRIAGRRMGVSSACAISAMLIAYALFSRSLQAMSSVAMLDIYSSSLSLAALVAALWGRWLLSAITLGLAIASKYTSLFIIPAIMASALLRGLNVRRALFYSVCLPLLVLVLTWTPAIAFLGVERWAQEVVGSVEWHLTTRPSGPPSTTPWGLLLGCQPFTLHYVNGKPLLVAACNPTICLGGLVISILVLLTVAPVLCVRKLNDEEATLLTLALAYLSVVGGYFAVYIAGNKTLYSFYSVQISLISMPLLMAVVLAPSTIVSGVKTSRAHLKECISLGLHKPIVAFIAFLGGLAAATLPGFELFEPRHAFHSIYFPFTELLRPWWSSKLVRVVAIAAAAASALKSVTTVRRDTRTLVLVMSWLCAGLSVALWHDNALALAVIPIALMGIRGLADGIVIGVVAPTPAYALLSSHAERVTSCLVGFWIGYALRVLLAALLLGESSVSAGPAAIVVCACLTMAAYAIHRLKQPLQHVVPLLVVSLDPTSLHMFVLLTSSNPGTAVLASSLVLAIILLATLTQCPAPMTLRAISLTILALTLAMLLIRWGRRSGA